MTDSLLLVSDLDGSLLDEQTYDFEPARPALAELARRGIPLVLCSSKTRAEMEPLAQQLGVEAPLIVENGGALLLPDGFLGAGVAVPGARREGDHWLFELGKPHASLMGPLAEMATEAAVVVRPFSALSAHEVAKLTGLTLDAAALALRREYDEPFQLDDDAAAPRVAAAALKRGLHVVHGGRFHHLGGGSDKGRAVRVLVGLYASKREHFTTVGFGDSGNDLPMLKAVQRAILIPRRSGLVDPELAAALPDAERASAAGPQGWNDAVLAVLEGRTLPPSS